jgi:hypothetical protein
MADYDSRPETLAHIERVAELLAWVGLDLCQRGENHDASKLVDPELDTFNEYTPKLRFGISDQLAQVLHNTVEYLDWWTAHNDGFQVSQNLPDESRSDG